MPQKKKPSHAIRNVIIVLLLIPLLLIGALLGIAYLVASSTPAGMDCNLSRQTAVSVDPKTIPATPIAGYGHDQLVNAAQIMLAAQKLGLNVRDQMIGVMVAMGESSLTVLDHGDAVGPDSRGLFQQRANGAWGTLADRMDPFISATNFFKVEMKVQGRETLQPTQVAHLTQQNADPNYYTPFWKKAQTVVLALAGVRAVDSAPTATDPTGNASSESDAPTQLPAGVSFATAGMKPQTVAVANKLGVMFHLKTIGGYRPMSSPYDDPKYGHSTGLAIDFMIDDIPNGEATGYALAKYAQEHVNELGVQYIIYRQHIWAPYRADEGWRLMPDRHDPTQNHMDHVHISLNGTGTITPSTSLPDADSAPGCTGTGADSTTGQITPSKTGWAKPAIGPVTSPFGMRTNPVTGVYKLHSGTDIGAACYAPIYAANAGTITQAGPATGYGNLITLDNGGGTVTRYAHMFDNGISVHAGDHVKAGQQIGKVGTYGNSTGCHLHFEVMQNGQFVDPVPFMEKAGAPLG